MEYRLIRSKRKTIAITVEAGGTVLVRAPRWASLRQIEGFLEEKQGWIEKRKAALAELEEERSAFCAGPGGTLPYLGEAYPVIYGEAARFTGEVFTVKAGVSAKKQLIGIYRGLARAELSGRVARFAPIVGAVPSGLRITSAQARFGSCSGKNALSFPWRLVMAKPALIDAVVVHELCHILEHNHSSRFWNEVERVLPDYRDREKGLLEFSRILAAQNWTE